MTESGHAPGSNFSEQGNTVWRVQGTVDIDSAASGGKITVDGTDCTAGVKAAAVLASAETALIDGVTAGTAAAGKAVSLDANSEVDSFAVRTLKIRVWNATGGTLSKDTLVYMNGANIANGVPTIAKADGNGADTLPTHVVSADIADAAAGYVFVQGLSAATLNTNAATAGDPVYASDTAGGWSLSVGTGQFLVGYVTVKSATVGQILWIKGRPKQPAYPGAAVATTASTQTTPFGFAGSAQFDALIAMVNSLRAAAIARGDIASS